MTPDQEIQALREATRAAHEVLQDLRWEHRALATERRRVETLLAALPSTAEGAVEGLIRAAVTSGLAAYSDAIKQAQRDAVEKVAGEFERLAAIYLGGTDGRPSLDELARVRRGLMRTDGP